MKRTYVIFILLLAISGLVYLLFSNFSYLLPENPNYSGLISIVALLSMLIIWNIGNKINIKKSVKYGFVWLVAILLLVYGYSYKIEVKEAFAKLKNGFVPVGVEHSDGSVTLNANELGHFHVVAQVNGVDVKFLIDTGATTVSLSQKDAERVGFNLNNLKFDSQVSTANGMAWNANVRIAEIRIQNIVINDVRGSVSRGGLDSSLLGMSFLEQLKKYEVSDNKLTLWD